MGTPSAASAPVLEFCSVRTVPPLARSAQLDWLGATPTFALSEDREHGPEPEEDEPDCDNICGEEHVLLP